jgi:hypothetical protein
LLLFPTKPFFPNSEVVDWWQGSPAWYICTLYGCLCSASKHLYSVFLLPPEMRQKPGHNNVYIMSGPVVFLHSTVASTFPWVWGYNAHHCTSFQLCRFKHICTTSLVMFIF